MPWLSLLASEGISLEKWHAAKRAIPAQCWSCMQTACSAARVRQNKDLVYSWHVARKSSIYCLYPMGCTGTKLSMMAKSMTGHRCCLLEQALLGKTDHIDSVADLGSNLATWAALDKSRGPNYINADCSLSRRILCQSPPSGWKTLIAGLRLTDASGHLDGHAVGPLCWSE